MIADLKPYPAMKDLGVEWLGEVPAHWEVRRLRRTLRAVAERNRSDLPLLSVVREKGVVLRDVSNKDENHNFIPDDLTNYKVVEQGQFAMNKMKAWQGSYGVSKFDGIVSPAYFVFNLDSVNGDYFHTAIRSKAYVPYFTQASDGVRIGQWDLSLARMREIPFSVPPRTEQAAIVRYLDYADRRIQRYIRAKQKLITLLEEQKQAIIHQAVTGQIDVRTGQPYPAYKPSGVEWLGDVPEHWEVLALKRVVRRLVDCEHKTAPAVGESDYRVVRTTAVRYGRLRWEGTYCTTATAFTGWTKRGLPEPGDVIFTREAPVGEACVVPEGTAVCLGQRTVLMKPQKGEYDSHFLVHMIYAGPPRDRVRLASQGSTVAHFNMDDIGWMQVLKPPYSEQLELVKAISNQTRVLELAVARAERETSLLHEFRTRLIAEVVTGKLDVREAASRLPDEVEEPEPLDETDALTEGKEEPSDDLDAAPEEAAV